MSLCRRERDKTIYWSHTAALLKITAIAFDPDRKARGGTTPRSTYVCPHSEPGYPHWHMTAKINTDGWKP